MGRVNYGLTVNQWQIDKHFTNLEGAKVDGARVARQCTHCTVYTSTLHSLPVKACIFSSIRPCRLASRPRETIHAPLTNFETDCLPFQVYVLSTPYSTVPVLNTFFPFPSLFPAATCQSSSRVPTCQSPFCHI